LKFGSTCLRIVERECGQGRKTFRIFLLYVSELVVDFTAQVSRTLRSFNQCARRGERDYLCVDSSVIDYLETYIYKSVSGHQNIVITRGMEDRISRLVFGYLVSAWPSAEFFDVLGRIYMIMEIYDRHETILLWNLI
tara:strand:+ start:60 stop:470 length:411 start_codon:yes stop_codon:yes gene_type:complete